MGTARGLRVFRCRSQKQHLTFGGLFLLQEPSDARASMTPVTTQLKEHLLRMTLAQGLISGVLWGPSFKFFKTQAIKLRSPKGLPSSPGKQGKLENVAEASGPARKVDESFSKVLKVLCGAGGQAQERPLALGAGGDLKHTHCHWGCC